MDLINLKSVDLIRTPPKIDDLLVCGGCGSVNKLTFLGPTLITKEEFNMLSEDEKKDLNFAARAVTKHLRNN
jgi:hypothetical protein